MAALATIFDYLREFAPDLGKRITEAYQPLHKPGRPTLTAPLKTSSQGAPRPGARHHGHREVLEKGRTRRQDGCRMRHAARR